MRKKNSRKIVQRSTGLNVSQMISQGNFRAAARMIGHSIDPKNPIAAGKKKMSPKLLEKATAIYKDQINNKKSLGQDAAKQISKARYRAEILRRTENWKPNTSREIYRRANNKSMARSLRNASAFIEGGKAARAAARNAGVFSIAAMVASHLAGEARKKNG